MTGAAKSYPPGEAPAAEAREQAALERELAPDAAPLDISPDDSPAEPSSLRRGAEAIRSFWRHAPMGIGVYRMIGEQGEVLYVGKARSIKKRIAAYIAPERQSTRIARMVAQTHSMVFVTTESEAEALLLEANLIKQLKPRYNVTLRDDKSFPYILVCTAHPAARLVKHRGARSIAGDYFGPFASAGAVFRTMNALQRAFLLRTCSDSYYAHRTRPCLLYQIKRCSGPCTGEIGLADYGKLVGEARAFLMGKSRAIRERLAEEMAQASAALEFEKAARLRDRITALSAIQGEQAVNPRSIPEADVFAVSEEAGQYCIEAFFFRAYQNWGNRAYFPRADRALSPEEVLDAFLAQFYLDRPPPRLVLLSHVVPNAQTLCEVLSARVGRRVAIGVPHRGEKKDLVEAAMRNAREALSRKLAEAASQEKLLSALAAAFGVDHPIRRIEVYDNSHIMGTNAIGAMVVAGPEGFVKKEYRTFNIKSADLAPGDDYAMMREVLTRRFYRLMKNGERSVGALAERASRGQRPRLQDSGETAEPGGFPDTPDLIVIDGGRGQFEAAREVLASLGVTAIKIAAIAKGPDRNAGRETFFIEGRDPFRLSPRDPALFFVERLRDEAHRFAI
ncbi:MAG: excinuclease ABC subunit UvrC, partial [Hyphomicrobiales bacterium]|nr:excinuclease ABC subunit UvrC [Hyphomicrobiales bacterium]